MRSTSLHGGDWRKFQGRTDELLYKCSIDPSVGFSLIRFRPLAVRLPLHPSDDQRQRFVAERIV